MKEELVNHTFELSPWGTIIVVVLAGAAMALFWWIDRQLLGRLLKAMALLLLQLAVCALCAGGLYYLDSWWADLGGLLLMTAACVGVVAVKTKQRHSRLLLPLFAGMLTGCAVLSLTLLLCLKELPARMMFVVVAAVLLSGLTEACTSTLQTYVGSLRHTLSHRRYLLANGASQLEMMMPSIRRAMRATVLPQLGKASVSQLVVMPLLLGGLLVGGVPPLQALAVSAILLVAVLAASVMATVVMLFLHVKFFMEKGANKES